VKSIVILSLNLIITKITILHCSRLSFYIYKKKFPFAHCLFFSKIIQVFFVIGFNFYSVADYIFILHLWTNQYHGFNQNALHRTKNSFFIIGYLILLYDVTQVQVFVNWIILYNSSFIIIITFCLCQTCVRSIIYSDFVMCLMQYLLSLFPFFFYILFLFILNYILIFYLYFKESEEDFVKSKRLCL